jgi:hypothetical protein
MNVGERKAGFGRAAQLDFGRAAKAAASAESLMPGNHLD